MEIRNIAIIAHVDHGKTTLVDSMLKQAGTFREGEKIATKYLETIGYLIKERNFKSKSGEIDIIAQKDDQIIFIEVKTRSSNNYGSGIEAINKIKQKHILITAAYYAFINHIEESNIQFDVIEILKKDKFYIKHTRNCEMLALV